MFVREVYGLLSKIYTETFRNYHNKMYDLAKQSKDSNIFTKELAKKYMKIWSSLNVIENCS